MRSAIFITWGLILPSLASAHHSVTGVFDPDQFIEVEGELTRVFWRNPHSRFWMTADDGETWEIEGGALRWLERGGVTRDLFVEGERIRVAGNPARRSANEMLAHNLLLSGGTEALMSSSATPRWSEQTVAFQFMAEADAATTDETGSGIFRVWSRDGARQDWVVSPTEAARSAREQWVAARDDPTLRCIAPGMVEAMTSPYPMELSRDGNDIVIRLEEWDGIRRVHMQPAGNADGVPRTPMGYSVGRWEGNTLVVSTTRIDWPYLDSLGTPQSEDVTMVERFAMNAEQTRLTWDVVITDPTNLTEPATVRQQYVWIPGVEVQPYDCALSDEAE